MREPEAASRIFPASSHHTGGTDEFRSHPNALSYYFLFSLFPLLIFLAAAVNYLPIPDLFNQVLNLMARFVPPEAMTLVRAIVSDVISPRRGSLTLRTEN